jgi:hypothetical protein
MSTRTLSDLQVVCTAGGVEAAVVAGAVLGGAELVAGVVPGGVDAAGGVEGGVVSIVVDGVVGATLDTVLRATSGCPDVVQAAAGSPASRAASTTE